MHSRAGAQTPFSSVNYGMDTSPEGRMVIKNMLLEMCIRDSKFTYQFGRAIPALSLVLTMVLRLVPSYRRKADALMTARACIGKGPAEAPPWRRACATGAVSSCRCRPTL